MGYGGKIMQPIDKAKEYLENHKPGKDGKRSKAYEEYLHKLINETDDIEQQEMLSMLMDNILNVED